MRSKRALINMMVGLLYEAALAISGIIVPRFILQYYGSSVNGMIASITQFLSFIALLRAGVGGVTRAALYKPLEKNDKIQVMRVLRATQNFMRRIAVIFVIVVFCFSLIFWFIIGKQFTWSFSFIMVLILGVGTFSQYYFGMTYQLLLQADQKMYIWNLWQLGATIANILITVCLILTDQSIIVVKTGTAVVFSIVPILASVSIKRRYKIVLDVSPDNSAIEQRWSAFTYQIATYIHENTDILVLTVIRGIEEVSVYSVYSLVINSCIRRVIETIFNGFDAAIGNMIARDEHETLDRTMTIFELLSTGIASILFACVVFLMTSFLQIYTLGVNDINYIRPVFLVLLVFAELVYCLRLPYYSIVTAKGLYRETQRGAIVEAALNLSVSLVLVFKFGLVGVAIGTCVAMLFRYVDLLLFTNKYIIKRNFFSIIRLFFTSVGIFLVAFALSKIMPTPPSDSFAKWFVYSFFFFTAVSVCSILLIWVINPNEIKLVYQVVARLFIVKEKRK